MEGGKIIQAFPFFFDKWAIYIYFIIVIIYISLNLTMRSWGQSLWDQ